MTANSGPSRAQPTETGFERPVSLKSVKIAPTELLSGEHYQLAPTVEAHGYANRYNVDSVHGRFEAVGEYMLRTRIQEIKALAALDKIKKTDAFGLGLTKAAKSPFEAAKTLVSDPVGTITGIPKGIYRFFARLGEMANSEPGHMEQGRAKEIVGFAALKRKIAHKLNVDVYSSNPILQRELDEVTWAGFAGGMSFTLLFSLVPLPGPMSQQIAGVKFSQQANAVLRDNAPADLRRMNREALRAAGLDSSTIEGFLDNPWLSPAHQVRITLSVQGLDGVGGKNALLDLAAGAGSEAAALLYQQAAEMTLAYHRKVFPVRSLAALNGTLVFHTAENALVAVMPADRLFWTAWLADFLKAAETYKPPLERITLREVWVAGRASTRAKKELADHGFATFESARAWLSAASQETETASPDE